MDFSCLTFHGIGKILVLFHKTFELFFKALELLNALKCHCLSFNCTEISDVKISKILSRFRLRNVFFLSYPSSLATRGDRIIGGGVRCTDTIIHILWIRISFQHRKGWRTRFGSWGAAYECLAENFGVLRYTYQWNTIARKSPRSSSGLPLRQ